MSIRIIFDNIENEIISHLNSAQNNLKIAVTWFTSKKIFDIILKKLESNVGVELIITADEINFSATGLDFKNFITLGGNLYLMHHKNLMHHKFCIIDNKIVINGSYNWTQLAEANNYENIMILDQNSSNIELFLKEFSRVINAEGILFNKIVIFESQPIFNNQIIKKIEHIEQRTNQTNNDEIITQSRAVYLRKIYPVRSINGIKFCPIIVGYTSFMMNYARLYFAWETEYDFTELLNFDKNDVFSRGIFTGIVVKNKFENLFFTIAKETGFFWDIYRYRNNANIAIDLFIKEGETYQDALKNLGYND